MERMQVSNEELNVVEDLPREISTDILSRLPVASLVECRAVRKAWCDLVNHHVPTPDLPVVVFSPRSSSSFKFEDSPNRLVVKIPGYHPVVAASLKGLILLYRNHDRIDLSICNPITREYVCLHPPPPHPPPSRDTTICCGFGLSTAGEYKVVRMIHHECQVYTLGTGLWRTIPVALPALYYRAQTTRFVFVAGNLHWLASTNPSLSDDVICCFDLEAEAFSSFPPPPRRRSNNTRVLAVLEDCLCLCEMQLGRLGRRSETIVWLMRDGMNWTKHFDIVLKGCSIVIPIKVDGDLVLLADARRFMLYYYSKTTKTVSGYCYNDSSVHLPTTALAYTPTFVSLRTFLTQEEQPLQSF